MHNAIRKDKFEISELRGLPAGYYILRKQGSYLQSRGLLEALTITDIPLHAESSSLTFFHPEAMEFFECGDIAFVSPKGVLRVVLSKLANHNTLLVTERCDNLCLFCSQPPKDNDDSWLLSQAAMAAIEFDSNESLGISGGEPLIYGQSFINFLDTLIDYKCDKSLHILSNGRKFSDTKFTLELAKRRKDIDLTFGIPLYSSVPHIHDMLVGSIGAFRDTMQGLINAGNAGIKIELRIIPTKENIDTLSQTVELVSRSISNVVQFSIMNMEATGWARKNWKQLYIDPIKYAEELEKSVLVAHSAGLPAFLFNYPLCHIKAELEPLALKSISDWKNFYPEECSDCSKKDQCSGFFTSSKGIFHEAPRRIV